MTDRPGKAEDWRELAAEYALAVLSGEELEAAAELERSDAEFRAEAARWRGRLAPMIDEVASVAPPGAVWARIAERTSVGRGDNVVQLRRRVRVWQVVSAAATAVAAALGVVAFTGTLRTQPAPQQQAARPAPTPLVAMLGQGAKNTTVVASWDPAAQQLILAVPGELRAAPNHSHELWVIPPGGKPRSLGVMPSSRQMHMKLAEALARLLDQGATIAISVEPAGGSPTGAPTGPVVASGALTRA